MTYLILQTFLLLLIAALVGGVIGWYLKKTCCQKELTEQEKTTQITKTAPPSSSQTKAQGKKSEKPTHEKMGLVGSDAPNVDDSNNIEEASFVARKEADAIAEAANNINDSDVTDDYKPKLLDSPSGDADNLQLIKGIGPKLNGVLNELGIYHFQQIADFTPKNVAWVNKYLSFKGRIQREDWIAQAKVLASGGDTEFSARNRKTKK